MTAIRFGDLREFVDHTNRVSICMQETLCYENFARIDQVPDTYDGLYLYGFGVIESEFPQEGRLTCQTCLEIVLSKEPRKDP